MASDVGPHTAETDAIREACGALPSAPCRACGPGYRIGDEGCRHDPYQPDEGETGICRTCAQPIWWETGEVGHIERVGWSDRIKRGGDSLVCFSAIHYRHQPMGSREAAIYRAGFKAGQATEGRLTAEDRSTLAYLHDRWDNSAPDTQHSHRQDYEDVRWLLGLVGRLLGEVPS